MKYKGVLSQAREAGEKIRERRSFGNRTQKQQLYTGPQKEPSVSRQPIAEILFYPLPLVMVIIIWFTTSDYMHNLERAAIKVAPYQSSLLMDKQKKRVSEEISFQTLLPERLTYKFDPYRLAKTTNGLAFEPALFKLNFMFWCVLFGIVGFFLFVRFSSQFFKDEHPILKDVVLLVILSSFLTPLFVYAYTNEFDKKSKLYLKDGLKIPLQTIRGVQLISSKKYVSYHKNHHENYINYELNIILPDGKRQNVTRYSSKINAINDARAISTFLGVPLLKKFSL